MAKATALNLTVLCTQHTRLALLSSASWQCARQGCSGAGVVTRQVPQVQCWHQLRSDRSCLSAITICSQHKAERTSHYCTATEQPLLLPHQHSPAVHDA
jgi:hypothetical protein